MKTRTCFFILISFVCTKAYAQDSSPKDVYNFNFEINGNADDGWIKYFPTAWYDDTRELVDGKYPRMICPLSHSGLPFEQKLIYACYQGKTFPFEFNIGQTVFLPKVDPEAEVKISINSKNRKIKQARLGIARFDEDENMVYCDSLNILSECGWKEHALSFPARRMKYVKLDISGKGNPEDTATRVAWIDRIHFEINGKSIYDYPLSVDTNGVEDKRLEERKMVPLAADGDGACSLACYDDPRKKIIALGESMHGCEDVSRLALEHAAYLIEHRNCKAVLLEIGMDVGLKWDLYVRGLTPDKVIEEIAQEIRRYRISLVKTVDFLKWLRNYNKTQARKVRIFGLDHPGYPEIWVFDYLALIQKNRMDVSFLNLMEDVDKGNFQKVMDRLQEDSKIKKELSGKEFKYLLKVVESTLLGEECYNDTLNLCSYQQKYIERRDYYMAERTRWIVDNFLKKEERVFIHAHSGHINKLPLWDSRFSNIPNNSLGKCLSDKFGDKYLAIAIQVGEGNYQKTVNPLGQQEAASLSVPPINSFEKLAGEAKPACFFYRTCDLPADISYFRYTPNGNSYRSQFVYAALTRRFDGLIFIRRGEALNNGVKLCISESFKFRDDRKLKRQEFLKKLRKTAGK